MSNFDIKEFQSFVEERMKVFRAEVLENLKNLSLDKLISRKNPYLYMIKDYPVEQLIRNLLEISLHESEESKFGTVLEEITRYVAEKTHGATKSSAEGIDLEFTKNGIIYLLSIKSGPNWGNADQHKQMLKNFKSAIIRLNTNNTSNHKIVCINGICYGKTSSKSDKGTHFVLRGQEFWEFLSGDRYFYESPILFDALKLNQAIHSDLFKQQYFSLVEGFSKVFYEKYCRSDGSIDYTLILKDNAGSTKYQEEDELKIIQSEVETLFISRSSDPHLDKEYITSTILNKLLIPLDRYAKTGSIIMKYLKESGDFKVKGSKVFRKGIQ